MFDTYKIIHVVYMNYEAKWWSEDPGTHHSLSKLQYHQNHLGFFLICIPPSFLPEVNILFFLSFSFFFFFHLMEDYKHGIIPMLYRASCFLHLALRVSDSSMLPCVALVHFHCWWICLNLFMYFLVNEPLDWFPFFETTHFPSISWRTLDHLFWFL